MRRFPIKRTLSVAIAAICVYWVAVTFDWHAVVDELKSLRIKVLLTAAAVVVPAIFCIRGLRWIAVLGLEASWRRIIDSTLANGAILGLAVVTPFQLGELLKVKLVPKSEQISASMRLSAVLLERVLDLCGVVGIGLAGLALHRGWAIGMVFALLPAFAGATLVAIGPRFVPFMPDKLQPYLEALRHPKRVALASVLTIAVWLLYGVLWWSVGMSVNVSMDLSQVALLLGAVMLAIVATMSPAGLGVSELTGKGILVWAGMDAVSAESVAIALRLLTPLFVVAGALCAALLWIKRRSA